MDSDLSFVFEGCFELLCGELLGEGLSRKVFACKLLPDMAVKVESGKVNNFNNVYESYFWDMYQHMPKVREWLAPCHFMSPDGRVLIQSRAEVLPDDYELPSKLPHFLTDIKRDNFGLIDDELVCVDYAMVVINPSVRLVKADWG